MRNAALFRKIKRLLNLAIAIEKKQITPSQLTDFIKLPQNLLLRRREFLKSTSLTLAGSAALAWGCKTAGKSTPTHSLASNSNPGKIVIVGGGIAGLTSAYRLANAGLTPEIFEASPRFGGRMYTQRNFNTEGMFCELGGELVDTGHSDLIDLCRELGLNIQELTNDPGLAKDLFYFHGSLRSEAEIVAAFAPLAKVIAKDQEALTIDGSVTVPTYNSKLARHPRVMQLDRTSLSEYLSKIDCDTWLKDLILMTYLGMMGGEPSEQSALNLLTLIITDTTNGFLFYGESDESKRIEGGNESLPIALVNNLHKRLPMHLNSRLLRITGTGTGLNLTFLQESKTLDIAADTAIIAIPFSTLRQVEFKNINLSPAKKRAIDEWGYGSNSKFMMGFTSKAWQKAPSHASGSIYGDFASQCFWDTSVGQSGHSGIITNFLGGKSGKIIPKGQLATALKDLEQVFPGSKSAFDGNKVLQHWPSQEFTLGSYTCLKPGQYTAFYGVAGTPEHQNKLLFAGEHCSIEHSGYMNGGVESGNLAAQLILKTS